MERSLLRMLFARLFSGSCSVEEEVLKRLPRCIKIEFRAEFDDRNNPVIVISAPDHPGLISEADNFKEAVQNACDAILTCFDVPREYANLIEYKIEESSAPQRLIEERGSLLKSFTLRQPLAHA